jgi:methionyl-tRNA formyltransferase
MGSPNFSVPILADLAKEYTVVGVITQQDRPAGRGRKLTQPPIKGQAITLGIPFIQPHRLHEPDAFAQLQAWQPDLIVVAAFGQILKPLVLDLPKLGCINVHASLLPRWRGAAPVHAAILYGDTQTGITIMRMDPGVDTGLILNQRSISILNNDTTESLGKRLALLGADLLFETLPGYIDGRIQPVLQNDTLATYAPMLKKEDGLLILSLPADELERRVRAFHPWPGANILWQEKLLKIHRAHAIVNIESPVINPSPGQTTVFEGYPAVWTGQGLLVLDEVQPANKKPMPGKAFLAGAPDWGM